ncbi:MAG: DUF2018 family protein [Thiovulaceae bacterium]|nr:DUF2018 family protein [Sulfurimonadaceae bacterium]
MSDKNKYAALFEDDDDIFLGSPKSKFLDIVFNANSNLVKDELSAIIERMAAMEIMLEEKVGGDWERQLATNDYERKSEVEEKAKSLYIEHTGNVLSQNE